MIAFMGFGPTELIILPIFILWIWMLVNCLLRPTLSFPGGGASKVAWIIALVAAPPIGTLAYFFMVYLPRSKQRPVSG
ncbi:MAG: PLDc N-terminal domain-containing protein [Actinomycetota bacterium]